MYQGLFTYLTDSYGKRSRLIYKTLIHEAELLEKCKIRRHFLHQCLKEDLLPKMLWFHLPGEFDHDWRFKRSIGKRMLHKQIGKLCREITTLERNLSIRVPCLRAIITDKSLYKDMMDYKTKEVNDTITAQRQKIENKLNILRKEFKPGFQLNESTTFCTFRPHEQPLSNRDNLVTDITQTLNESELSFLKKGPKFILADGVNANIMIDFNVQFSRLAHQVRWKEILEKKKDHPPFIQKYPWHSSLTMPNQESLNSNTENSLKKIYHKLKNVVEKIPHQRRFNNISEKEASVLETLRQKPLVFLPSDKGGEFCVMSQQDYNLAGLNHLNNPDIYLPIAHITPGTIEKRLNSVWKDVAIKNNIPHFIMRSYITNNSEIPSFYHLIKTHKGTDQIKIRPIVSNSNGPTKKLSWLLTKLLTPLLNTVPSHLRNSDELMESIKNNMATERIYFPCSFDIAAMYTSIPVEDCLLNITHAIEYHHNLYFGLPTPDIVKLLRIILTNTYFKFQNRLYKQKDGLPMGSSLSGLLAITFIDTLEKRALSNVSGIPLFKRYVDDCFLLAETKEQAFILLDQLNNQHPNIKFEIELPTNNNELSLLDFTVKITSQGGASFEFYKKPARKNIFVNYKSSLPENAKLSFIRNEYKRIQNRCSSEELSHKNTKEFDRVLQLNGYPTEVIKKAKTERTKKKEHSIRKNSKDEHLNFKFPYISDNIDRQIKRIFKRENINIRLVRQGNTLRQCLKRPSDRPACSLNGCPIKNSDICHRKNVVYQLTCNVCRNTYIGSTIRPLHTRIKEHISRTSSSFYKHLRSCNTNNFTTTILTSDNDSCNIRLKEAIYIKKLKPTINNKEEQEAYSDFLYV